MAGDLPYSLDPDTVLQEFQKRLKASFAHSKEWRDEARQLYDYVAGRQWDPEDEARMDSANRPRVTFNVLAKFIDAVNGLQINNRQEIRCYPRQQGSVAVSDVANGAIAWNTDQCDGEYEDTDAGSDCLLTGMGWVEIFLDGPEGDEVIARERRDNLEMYWDPMARKKNVIDGRYVIRLRRMSIDDYREIFGEDPEGALEVPGLQFTDTDMGLQIIDSPHDYPVGSSSGAASQAESRGKVVVADYQFWCIHNWVRSTAQVTDPNTGLPVAATQDFHKDEWPQVEQQLKAAGAPYQAQPMSVKKYYRCFITGGGIKQGIKDLPWQEGFTYQGITGKRDRNKNVWYGLGRQLKDPQNWVNKFFSSLIWQISVNPKGGIIAEEGAAADTTEFEDTWADPSAVTWVQDGKIASIQPKPAMQFPVAMQQLTQFSMEALPQTSGIPAELLGLTDREQPGIVEAQRKQGALAIVAWFFDGMRRYYKHAGRCMLSMIQKFQADGRLIRIVGQQGAQYVPLLKSDVAMRFDIIVDEAPTSVNMQERVWAVIQQLLPLAVQAGVRPPPEIYDYAPVPADLQQALKQQLQTSPQQMQEDQIRKQLMAQASMAKTAKDNAQAIEAQAGAQLKSVQAQVEAIKAPSDIALNQVETVRKAAEAGSIQAGG